MFEFLFQILGVIGILFTLFVLYQIFRRQKAPATQSNRIDKARLLWYVLTREDRFFAVYTWIKNGEWDKLKP